MKKLAHRRATNKLCNKYAIESCNYVILLNALQVQASITGMALPIGHPSCVPGHFDGFEVGNPKKGSGLDY